MRTKFTVVYEARWKYTCAHNNESGVPFFQKDDLSFTSKYYYCGYKIDDCLKAFWSFINTHGYAKPLYGVNKTYQKNIIIKEVLREENISDDYACGWCNLTDDEWVVTQITSDMVVHLWSTGCCKHNVIIYNEPRKIKDKYEYLVRHYGKGIENLKIGDLVSITCEKHSLISGGTTYYNVIGKTDMEAAKKFHTYALRDTEKYIKYYFNKLRERGIEPIIVDPLNCGY